MSNTPSLLESLPGEIRNNIYEFCIDDAIRTTPSERFCPWATPPSPSKFDVSVSFPRRKEESPVLAVHGLRALPLLCVNRGVYRELSALLYARVEIVTFNGYTIQYPNDNESDNPIDRWEAALAVLQRQPSLLKHATHIIMTLPAFENHRRGDSSSKISWNGAIPALADLLLRFEALKKVWVVILKERGCKTRDFAPLLLLSGVGGAQTIFEFQRRGRRAAPCLHWPGIYTLPVRHLWQQRWDSFVRERDLSESHDRIDDAIKHNGWTFL